MSSIRKPIATQTGLFSMYLTAAIAFVFSLVYLDIPSYVYVLYPSILPKYFYFAIAVIVAPLLLLNFRGFLLYMVSPFSLWAFTEIIIHSYNLIDANEVVTQLILLRNQYLVLAILLGFIVSIARTESYEGIFRILAIAVPVLVIIDFISPGFFYPIDTAEASLGRAAAMYINPTRAGEVILITSLLAIPITRLQYRMPLLLLSGAGAITTFSRAAIIAWMLFWLFLLITRKLPKYSVVFPLILLAVLPLLLSIFTSYIQERQDITYGLDNIIERLDFFKAPSIKDDSGQERTEVLVSGVQIFLENPIFGAGAGITSFTSNIWPHRGNTHNQIAMAAAEHGIFGIALWVWLLVILWRGRYFQDTIFQLAATVGVLLMSFFAHLLLTEVYWLMTYALISGRRRA